MAWTKEQIKQKAAALPERERAVWATFERMLDISQSRELAATLTVAAKLEALSWELERSLPYAGKGE